MSLSMQVLVVSLHAIVAFSASPQQRRLQCSGRATCGPNCMPYGSVCCADGQYCPAGTYCGVGDNCPKSGGTTRRRRSSGTEDSSSDSDSDGDSDVASTVVGIIGLILMILCCCGLCRWLGINNHKGGCCGWFIEGVLQEVGCGICLCCCSLAQEAQTKQTVASHVQTRQVQVPPRAQTMQGHPQAQTMQVQVPVGEGPGSVLQIQAPDGQLMQATVPAGIPAGGSFTVQCPPAPAAQKAPAHQPQVTSKQAASPDVENQTSVVSAVTPSTYGEASKGSSPVPPPALPPAVADNLCSNDGCSRKKASGSPTCCQTCGPKKGLKHGRTCDASEKAARKDADEAPARQLDIASAPVAPVLGPACNAAHEKYLESTRPAPTKAVLCPPTVPENVCSNDACSRRTASGFPTCCRTCGPNKGLYHGPECNAAHALKCTAF